METFSPGDRVVALNTNLSGPICGPSDHLREVINAAYGANFATSQMEITFPVKDGKEFCQIDVKRGKEPLYTAVSGKAPNAPKVEKFFVRSGNSSRELPIDEIPKYVSQRFNYSV